MDENMQESQPITGDTVEANEEQAQDVAVISKYCHNVSCDWYNLPQPYSRTLCFECGDPLYTSPA